MSPDLAFVQKLGKSFFLMGVAVYVGSKVLEKLEQGGVNLMAPLEGMQKALPSELVAVDGRPGPEIHQPAPEVGQKQEVQASA